VESDDLEPGRDRWSRSAPHSTLPPEISQLYWEIRHKFGIVLANLVLFAYQEWGPRVARELAREILKYDDFEEVILELEDRVRRLGPGREAVARIIWNLKYQKYFEELSRLRDQACRWDIATELFHSLAQIGYFFPPKCIVNVANYLARCEGLKKECARVCDAIREIIGDEC